MRSCRGLGKGMGMEMMKKTQVKLQLYPHQFMCFSSSSSNPKRLILYSKPGCCLCDGLKEKLHSAFPPHLLLLQIRDISENPEWEKAYQYEIPVLAKLRPDGTEEILPRFSPRTGVEVIQRKIDDAFRQ